jgi:hypothetical protein
VEVANDGRLVWRTGAGHHAVGAGGEAALLARAVLTMYAGGRDVGVEAMHAGGRDVGVEMAKAIAYRAVMTTLELSAGIPEAPVQIAVADATGARVLGREELAAVRALADRWAEAELETVRRIFATQVAGTSDGAVRAEASTGQS